METVLYPQLFCPGGGGERATVSWNARVILRSVFVERAKNCSFREYYTDFKSAVHKKKKKLYVYEISVTQIFPYILYSMIKLNSYVIREHHQTSCVSTTSSVLSFMGLPPTFCRKIFPFLMFSSRVVFQRHVDLYLQSTMSIRAYGQPVVLYIDSTVFMNANFTEAGH